MFTLPIGLLFVISIVTSWSTSFLRGFYSKHFPNEPYFLWNFNFFQNLACLIGVVLVYAVSGGLGQFSWFSVGLGIAVGICSVVGLNANLEAFSTGPFAYTSVIVALSAIIPTLSGLFFGETISASQYVGIGLMIVCILLSPQTGSAQHVQKANTKWLLLCLLAALCSGCLGVIQKVHQQSIDHRSEMAAMLIIGFAVSTICAGIQYLRQLPQSKAVSEKIPRTARVLWLPILCGLSFSFPHTVNLFLVGQVPAAIFFPIVNLTPMLLTMVSAVVIFKERLSRKRWIGIGVGILSTVFLSGILGF